MILKKYRSRGTEKTILYIPAELEWCVALLDEYEHGNDIVFLQCR